MTTNDITGQHLIAQILQLNRENACLKTELCKYKIMCYYYEKLSNLDNNSEQLDQRTKLNEQILALKSVSSPIIRLIKLRYNDPNDSHNNETRENIFNVIENSEKNQTTNCYEQSFNEVIKNIISVIDEQVNGQNRDSSDSNHVSADNREADDKTNNDNESILSDHYSNPDNDCVDIESVNDCDISNAEQTDVIRNNELTNELNANENINIEFEMIGKKEINCGHSLEDNCDENNQTESSELNDCLVCGDNAKRNYYGVKCCEACKRFFYQSIKVGHYHYRCAFDGNCFITRVTRVQCQYCRYNKCIAVGMCVQPVGLGPVVKFNATNNNNALSLLAPPLVRQSSHDFNANEEENGDSCVRLNVIQEDKRRCKVCGDYAYNQYGVECCGSCRKFFHNALKTEQIAFSCVGGGNCLMTPQTRTKCLHCRFNKCLAAGISYTAERCRVMAKSAADCNVCGDNACGNYNGAVCCNACKKFFEKTVINHKKYSGCSVNAGNCLITRDTRTWCRFCRYNKCLSAGMSPESVRSRLGKSLLVSVSDKEQSLRAITDTSMISNVTSNCNESAMNGIIDANNTDNNVMSIIDESNNCQPNLRRKNDVNYNIDDFSDDSLVLPFDRNGDESSADEWTDMNSFEYLTKKYVCDHVGCGKVFMSDRNLRTHQKMHTNQTVTCVHNGCGIILKNDAEYNNHMRRNHPELFPEMNWIECTEDGCVYKTKLNIDFADHQKYHENLKAKANICLPIEYNIEKRGFVLSKVKVNSRSQLNKWRSRLMGCKQPFKCDELYCRGMFRSQSGLSRHKIRTHGKPILRVCDIDGCNFSEMRLDRFKAHQERHSGIRNYKCDHEQCVKTFLTKHDLRIHKLWHSPDKRYVCEWPGCEKRFKTNASLFQHKRYHSAIPAYRCDWPECEYGTPNKWNLEKHKARHTGIQKYACVWPSCEYKTANQSNLNTHIKMHNRVKIPKIPKSYD